jgi:hypothetical protein
MSRIYLYVLGVILALSLIAQVFLIAGCGTDTTIETRTSTPPEQTEIIRKELLRLQGVVDSIQSLVLSDFATCQNAGETADALVRKICNIAKYANSELLAKNQAALKVYVDILQDKINATNDQLAGGITSIESLNTSVATINTSITTITNDITNIQNSITTINAQIASISGSISGGMNTVSIGEENVSAGPVYETLLRRVDKTRINGYIEANSSFVALASNPFNASNGSADLVVSKPTATVTISNASPAVVTWTGHGWANGDTVMFSTSGTLPTGLTSGTVYYVRSVAANTFNLSATPTGSLINTSSAGSGTHTGSLGLNNGDTVDISGAVGGRGISNGHLRGEFVVSSVSVGSFTVTVTKTATSGGSLGGSATLISRINGRGLGTVWVTANGADSAVRQTSLGTKTYNFRIKANGDICYDQASATASFATINAEGVNIVCK